MSVRSSDDALSGATSVVHKEESFDGYDTDDWAAEHEHWLELIAATKLPFDRVGHEWIGLPVIYDSRTTYPNGTPHLAFGKVTGWKSFVDSGVICFDTGSPIPIWEVTIDHVGGELSGTVFSSSETPLIQALVDGREHQRAQVAIWENIWPGTFCAPGRVLANGNVP